MRAPGIPVVRSTQTFVPTRAPIQAVENAEAIDLGALYRTYAAMVGRWAARLGGPAIEAEDVVHEVFLVARRRLSSFQQDGGKITTWLFRTTEHVVRAARRQQRLRQRLGRSPPDLAPGMPAPRAQPDDDLVRRQEIADVYRVLDRLRERERRVLILFEIEGLSTQDISALTGAPVGTVRVWLFRARASFLAQYQAPPVSAGEAGKARRPPT
jgi:RNA polymerase sigma-70 factor, ECF subfamily